MIRRRDLLVELVASELRQRDAGTALGPIWWVLDPLILMLMYWVLVLVLGRGGGREAFPIFLLCGLLPAKFIFGSPANTAGILFKRRSLIQAYPFPTMFLPLSNVLANLVFFLIALPILALAGVLIFDRQIGLPAVQLLLLVPAIAILTIGLSLVAAVFGAMIRDLGNVLRYLARLATYGSPVIYGPDRIQKLLENVGEGGRLGEMLYVVYLANPLAIAIQVIRGAFHTPEWLAWQWWLVLWAEAVVIYLVGAWVYKAYERRIVKFV